MPGTDTYVLREPEIVYQAHFEAEKGCLSMDNGVYFVVTGTVIL